MSDCWFLADNISDRREENRGEPCSPDFLAKLGFYASKVEVEGILDDPDLFVQPLLEVLGYSEYDVIHITVDSLGGAEAFEELALKHYQEHLHEDDEVRLILGGVGYFDIRDENDKWVRVKSLPGDCLVIPAGIYHRFTTTNERVTHALRMFKSNPKWLAIPRGPEADAMEVRKAYLASIER